MYHVVSFQFSGGRALGIGIMVHDAQERMEDVIREMRTIAGRHEGLEGPSYIRFNSAWIYPGKAQG